MTATAPTTGQAGPYDREPAGRFIPQDERRALLAAAAAGVDLGDFDRCILDWLAGWDTSTVLAVAGIISRARTVSVERPTALEVAEARAAVNRAARQRRRELADTEAADLAPTRAETRAAAELLAEWFAAGRRRGIGADDWYVITRTSVLPGLALDALVFIARLA